MTVINVNGGNLQAAHNAATAGDTLALGGKAYAGLAWSKPLTIEGEGATITAPLNSVELRPTAARSVLRGVTIQGSTTQYAANLLIRANDVLVEDVTLLDAFCYGIRQYAADRLTMNRVTIQRVAVGVEVHRCGAGSVATDVEISDVLRMVVDSQSGNGGDGWQFFASTGPYRVIRPRIIRARARTIASWQYDGGAFSGYGPCMDVSVEDWYVENSVGICEMGTDSSMGGVPTGWTFSNGDAYGTPAVAPGPDKSCSGFFLRANVGCKFLNNRFHGLDDANVIVVRGGNYGGAVSGNEIAGNTIEVKPGVSATYAYHYAYLIASGVDPRGYSVHDNRVVFDPAAQLKVAGMTGKGDTADLASWQGWSGWSAGDVWGPAETPLQAAIRERDAALAALATANATIAAVSGQRDTAIASVASLTAKIAKAQADLA